jgi:hypothetical protein
VSRDEILAAISTLSEAIGFCQYEKQALQSACLAILIDGLVKLRGQLQRMLEEQREGASSETISP